MTEMAYDAWTAHKETSLRRRVLDCGCPKGEAFFFHIWCNRLACKVHADAPHDCSAFGGVGASSGIEEEAVPGEAVVEEPGLADLPTPSVHVVPRGGAVFLGGGASYALGPPGPLTPLMATARERYPRTPDGRFDPIDRVGEAFRAEVRRQGLAPREIEIDGRREWLAVEPTYTDTFTLSFADLQRQQGVTGRMDPDDLSIPGMVIVDEPWGNGVVMSAEQFDDLMANIDEPDEVPVLRRASERRFRRDPETVHRCPLGDSAITPCCGRSPFELGAYERMTVDDSLVTCSVDAACEPDSHGPQEVDGAAYSLTCASPQGAVTSDPRPAALKSEIGSRLVSEPQRPDRPYAALPWWRRFLPGGTR